MLTDWYMKLLKFWNLIWCRRERHHWSPMLQSPYDIHCIHCNKWYIQPHERFRNPKYNHNAETKM